MPTLSKGTFEVEIGFFDPWRMEGFTRKNDNQHTQKKKVVSGHICSP